MQRIGITQIEEVIGVVGIRFSGLVEEVGRPPRSDPTASKLDNPEVVQGGRAWLRVGKRLEHRKGFVVPFQVEVRKS